jgi:DNA-binding winged helix-turn-helix (wHTH) protein
VSANSSSRIIRFSTFELNLHNGELRQPGQKVKLEEQPRQVLAALLERPGEMVTREELRSKLWPADTFVDFDQSLNAAIKRLRDAFGELAETPVRVEKVARRGYRFIAPANGASASSEVGVATAPQQMDRTTLLRSLINVDGVGLEIGPSFNPLLPKSEGFNVETVDYADADGLRAKYRDTTNVDIAAIENVDYVIKGSGLGETIGSVGRYDYIVASHVIEHTPDLLGFLKDCESLLNSNGVLLLAVPDKRHCFDVFQPLSSTGGVVQAHFERRTRPPLGAIFDDRAYNAVRSGVIGWTKDDAGPLSFYLDQEKAAVAFSRDRQSQDYIDVHCWKFVPSSFRLIVNDLFEFGEIRLREKALFDSVGHEFYITLSRDGIGSGIDRLALAHRALTEHAEIILSGD